MVVDNKIIHGTRQTTSVLYSIIGQLLRFIHGNSGLFLSFSIQTKNKVKEVDLYSAFIVVPHTQGAQVRITQCYPQITPYLPLPRKHSPDGASHIPQTKVAEI